MKQGHEVMSEDRLMLVTEGTVCTETLGAFEDLKERLYFLSQPCPTTTNLSRCRFTPFSAVLLCSLSALFQALC